LVSGDAQAAGPSRCPVPYGGRFTIGICLKIKLRRNTSASRFKNQAYRGAYARPLATTLGGWPGLD